MLHVRWLGRVAYRDAHALQRGLFESSPDDHLLLLEHPHVYTLGVRADLANVLVPPHEVGADLVRADRGGDVTYHGPGQLTGYPILTVGGRGRLTDTVAYVRSVEQLVIDALADLGVTAGRLDRYPGVWIEDRKVCAVGVKLTRGRSMHGFALNVDPDLSMFEHIVPCGIRGHGVTSLRGEGSDVTMSEVVGAIAARAIERWGESGHTRADVADFDTSVQLRRRPTGLQIGERKPAWLRTQVQISGDYLRLKRTMRELDLVTVCEEAGCPNIFECWDAGTATFMINGERCTRACGFCLVDTRHPLALDDEEPRRVAEAVDRMGLSHAVITAVARDDLDDGGAAAFAATITAVRARRPDCAVEVLIPDCKGDAGALDAIFAARPDVLNHNIETVARLQRAVRPSAGYARSLAVLARAKATGLTTKSGLILGLGETDDEVRDALADLRGVGVDIVTIGQYLRPTAAHLPVSRWVTPDAFEDLAAFGHSLGIPHVEASPMTRSSYHAREAAEAAS
ncbi:MAG: lipoyl synthase [Actinomycetota bacterium]|nr:lipoyl synthase [Actinomycetota bacterium]